MTAEDVDFHISIAFDKLVLTPHQQQLNYLGDHKPIILKGFKEVRSKEKRPDVHSIYDYIMNSAASNINKTSVQTLIDHLIQKDLNISRFRFALYKVQQ